LHLQNGVVGADTEEKAGDTFQAYPHQVYLLEQKGIAMRRSRIDEILLKEPELRVSYGIEAVIGFGGRGLI
jgi:hypothetical protein